MQKVSKSVKNFLMKLILFFVSLTGLIRQDCRKGLKIALHFLSIKRLSPEAYQLVRQGYVILPAHVTTSTCEEIKALVEKTLLMTTPSETSPSNYSDFNVIIRDADAKNQVDTGMVHAFNIQNHINKINTYLYDNRLSNIIRSASSNKVHPITTHCYQNRGITKTRTFHCDQFYKWQFKAFLLLIDVEKIEQGPYTYLPGSSFFSVVKYFNIITAFPKLFTLEKSKFHRYLNDVRFSSKCAPIHMLGKQGTVVISDQNGYHRGWPQDKSAYRLVLVNDYYQGLNHT